MLPAVLPAVLPPRPAAYLAPPHPFPQVLWAEILHLHSAHPPAREARPPSPSPSPSGGGGITPPRYTLTDALYYDLGLHVSINLHLSCASGLAVLARKNSYHTRLNSFLHTQGCHWTEGLRYAHRLSTFEFHHLNIAQMQLILHSACHAKPLGPRHHRDY